MSGGVVGGGGRTVDVCLSRGVHSGVDGDGKHSAPTCSLSFVTGV